MIATRYPHRSSTLLDEFAQSLRNFLGPDNPQHLAGTKDEWRPLTDIRQNAERYLLEVELPGINREDIKIELANGELTIRCEREEQEGEDRTIRRERHLGGFVRHFRLPDDALQDKVSARMDNGILLVRVPRKGQTPEVRGIDVS